jgi:two-component system chemotaxis sensor kinase CheA
MSAVDPMEAIKITFFQECEEQLAELESGLLAMEAGDGDSEVVNAVFRAVHSIKGGAGAFGLDDLVRFAHVFETTLDQVRNGKLAPDPTTVLKPMLRAADVLADLVRAARDGGAVDAQRVQQTADELNVSGDAPEDQEDLDSIDFGFAPMVMVEDEPAQPAGAVWIVKFKPHPELYANANEAGLLLRELGRLGPLEVELDCSALPRMDALDPEGAYLVWTVHLTTDRAEAEIRDVFEFVDGDCDVEVRLADALEAAAEPQAAPVESAAPVKSGDDPAFDIMSLLNRVQQEAAAGDSAPVEAATVASVAPPVAAVAPTTAVPIDPAPAASAPGDRTATAALAAQAGPAGVAAAGSTIRVDLERVDRLIDLVGELVINQAMLSQRVMEAGIAGASAIAMGLDELEQLSREIQDSVMAIRAQPVKSVFQRMPRLAREVAAMTGKQVRLVTDGEGTEVDKTVIERLADPLTHMIRNAIDHGLESPQARIAAGKSPEGVVRLSAGHRSGRIVIEIADDGAGINRPKVKEIAVSRGLIAADASLSDDEIDNLIFLPGFSTATEITDVSGRGVGMDVVKRSIQALGGRISITSRPGKGSTFVMSLPLTLAVLDGMVVSLGEQTLVVPLTAIVETLQPKAADVHCMGGDARVIAVRDTYVPLIDVGQVLDYRQGQMTAGEGVVLLIEADGGSRAALLVDGIQGQRQVVIKSLEANYRHVPGIAAATILGDGRVALILDVDAVVAVSRSGEPSSPEPQLAMAS